MGNTSPTLGVKGSVDYGNSMKGRPPLLYHQVHSENVQLSLDQRKAKRVESFCKGICFSDRPVAMNERIHLKFAEVSTNWSGVVRLGFTSHDPATINASELPRYACPDLTYKPGYWAKALAERFAEQETTLYYYLTRSGDVIFGINGEEKGLFFSGVATNCNLWALVDIYGNTTCMEFIDGYQLNNLDSDMVSPEEPLVSSLDMNQAIQQLSLTSPHSPSASSPPPASPGPLTLPTDTSAPTGGVGSKAGANQTPAATNQTVAGLGLNSLPPVKYHYDAVFGALPFHHTMGRNVCLSSDRSVAVRMVGEYCNGYVFTQRPLQCEEALIIQILSLEDDYAGGLAFGMSSCDPMTLSPDELPDDSDLLLDRPEYWVVNKDVCTSPQVGDELSFYLTQEGEVRYGKNGHHIATLMFIDKTLPMWAFFDLYGNTQKIRSLGVIKPDSHGMLQQGSGLTVALPPPRSPASPATHNTSGGSTVPPRPPPPRPSPSGTTAPPVLSRSDSQPSAAPPSLPPKQSRSAIAPPLHPAALMQSSRAAGSPLPPPLVPTPLRGGVGGGSGGIPSPPPSVPERHSIRGPRTSPQPPPPPSSATLGQPRAPRPSKPLPQVPLSPPATTTRPPALSKPLVLPAEDPCPEALDNESNECKVCMNNAVDCVLYTCGHMCLCYECAQDIKNKHNLCPMCRQEIKDIIRIYRS